MYYLIFKNTDFTLFVSFVESFLVGLLFASDEEPTVSHPAGRLSSSDVSGGRKFVTAAVPGVDHRLCALEYIDVGTGRHLFRSDQHDNVSAKPHGTGETTE